ncbi:hypothetical protein DL95DRAFT_418469 [Leptodontidium sp. 2 PMI_412]|nr:hypothetical protein DL95DRAFT_418469 [Leptodontidium sp. 2 PMI_412]
MENYKGEGTEAEVKDDCFDDEEVLHPEEGTALRIGGVRRATRAEGRKAKRSRLTGKQTEFLMSEFAKDAYPDAARRERLSREIPGFNPRRVQVWFQNQRAKKNKMRAIPDDFNIQTLHSPYGATHGISAPVSLPVDFAPTLVDATMKKERADHMPLRSLSPACSHVGFAPGRSIGTPDVLSQSLNATGQYYPDYFLGPVNAGSRSSDLFDQQNNQVLPYQRRHVQLLELRETISSGSKPLQPTFSMSWEGDTMAQNISLLESRELEERTTAEAKSVRMKFEEVDKWELEFEDVAE